MGERMSAQRDHDTLPTSSPPAAPSSSAHPAGSVA